MESGVDLAAGNRSIKDLFSFSIRTEHSGSGILSRLAITQVIQRSFLTFPVFNWLYNADNDFDVEITERFYNSGSYILCRAQMIHILLTILCKILTELSKAQKKIFKKQNIDSIQNNFLFIRKKHNLHALKVLKYLSANFAIRKQISNKT